MDKSALRKSILSKLKKLPIDKKEAVEARLAQHLIHSQVWNQAKSIGITISQGTEWSTKPIIERAWEQGKMVCIPKCFPKEKKLVFYKFKSYDQLEVVYYNLQEPKADETLKVEKEQMDLLIVPGLVFDKEGFRIGFGGGYYDRFLTNFPNQTISLASSFQLVDRIPAEAFDIPVKRIVTEKGIQ